MISAGSRCLERYVQNTVSSVCLGDHGVGTEVHFHPRNQVGYYVLEITEKPSGVGEDRQPGKITISRVDHDGKSTVLLKNVSQEEVHTNPRGDSGFNLVVNSVIAFPMPIGIRGRTTTTRVRCGSIQVFPPEATEAIG